MADFSNSLPDPLEAARRRHGFSTAEDLGALDRLVALAAGEGGAACARAAGGGAGTRRPTAPWPGRSSKRTWPWRAVMWRACSGWQGLSEGLRPRTSPP